MDAPTAAASQRPSVAPFSGLVITGFVLSIVLGFFGWIGAWWLPLVAVAFVLFALPSLTSGRRRGVGLAIAAVAIAGLCAVGTWWFWRMAADYVAEGVDRLLGAMDQGDEALLREWAAPGDDAAVARWRERMVRAKAELGERAGSTEVRTGLWGPVVTAMIRPKDVEPVDGGEAVLSAERDTLWAWARPNWQRGRAWLAVQVDLKAMREMKSGSERGPWPLIRDVRFFRDRAGER